MHVGRKTQKREKSAMTVSLYGNLFFVIVELVIAIITSSQAVLLDAVYDGVEFFMLLPSIFLIPLLYKPSNEKHPFGYMQIETLFVVVKGITMTAVTLGLIANNINLMLHGGHIISFSTVAYFELSACILGIGVSLYLKRKNRVMNSPLIEMEMQGWQIDSIISLGMTAAFLLPMFVPFRWFQVLIPYVDQIITVVLSLFMIPVPIKTVITGIRDLILIPPEEETIEEIKATVEPVINSYQHRKLYYDIVRTGRKLWISVYITFEKDEISLSRFKIVQTRCIEALAEKYTDFYFELLPDIEFTGLESEPKSKDKASAKEENDGNISFGKEKINENTGNGETIKKDTTATQEDNTL
ncbi:MAG: cation transporter [Lachnospiraceae bacterium]|nr:cation transporter [Lachnospiraceae bacterium]